MSDDYGGEPLDERIAKNNAYYASFAADQSRRTQARDYARAFEAFCALLPDGGVVLDVGCGEGRHLQVFADRGYRPIGIDPSPDMRAAAVARGFTVMDGSFETLYDITPPLADGAWAAASLLHVPRAEVPAALHNLTHFLRPGGPLFVTVRVGSTATWDSWDDRSGERSRLIQLFEVDDLLDTLLRCGFPVVESWTETSTWGRPSTWVCVIAKQTTIPASNVAKLVTFLEGDGIRVWLDGGWGVDALLGSQTRPHADLDIVIDIAHVRVMIELLAARGFEVVDGEVPWHFVLSDRRARRLDVHPVRFQPGGDGLYRMEDGTDWPYPAQGFTGQGRVAGTDVRCLSAQVQVTCHAGYTLDEQDVADMLALRERFGVELSAEQSGRALT